VRKRKFHVYPVTTIGEGIEILTGTAAGARGRDGSFPPGTVFGRVERRLVEMAEASRRQTPAKAP